MLTRNVGVVGIAHRREERMKTQEEVHMDERTPSKTDTDQ